MNQTQPSLYPFTILKKDLTKTRYVVLISFMLAAIGAEAQFSKGDKYLGGTLGIGASSTNSQSYNWTNTKSSSVSLSPTVGFFLNDKWVVGGGLGYNTARQTNKGSGLQNYKSNWFSVNMLSRRYFALSDKFYFALEGSLRYSRGENTDNSNALGEKTKSYSVGTNVRPLFIFFPTANWGIEAGIGGLSYSYERNLTFDYSSNNLGANFGGFSLGFAYYFRNAE